MILLFITLALFPHLPVHNCLEIITSERHERPQRSAHFVIPGLNLSSLDTFTMCGRFKTYQFMVHSEVVNGEYRYKEGSEMFQGIVPGLSTYSHVHCDKTCPSIHAAANMKLKHVYVVTYLFGKSKVAKTSLKSNTWNSFSLKANNTSANLKLNGESFITHKYYEGSFPYSTYDNYRFMNDPYFKTSPIYGAIADLNIWDRILPDDESELLMNCTNQPCG